jgi:hypothetical protein
LAVSAASGNLGLAEEEQRHARHGTVWYLRQLKEQCRPKNPPRTTITGLNLTEPELEEAQERSSTTARVVYEAVRREGEEELKQALLDSSRSISQHITVQRDGASILIDIRSEMRHA